MDDNELAADALSTVQKYNRAWTMERAPGKLVEFFHPEMVAISPGTREPLVGAEKCIEGWSTFANSVRITGFRACDEKVKLWCGGEAAVVTYCYEISWEKPDGTQVDSSGLDMYVLVRENGRWWAVADQFSEFKK